MRLAIVTALAILPAAPAFAGGFGVLATGGMHTENLYFYSDHSSDGEIYDDINDYEQFELSQTLPNYGGGLELLLGDRDDRIMGSVRGFYLQDAAQVDPAEVTDQVDPEFVVSSHRDTPRHLGFGMVGLSWGIIGDPGGLQLAAVGHVGTAFLTLDHTEFLALQIGPGVTYKVARQAQVFADVQYMARFRQTRWSHSANITVGARYLFD